MDVPIDAAEPAVAPLPAATADRLAYSVSEAAALLGVSRVTVWRWIRSGRLSVTRLGHRTVLVRHDDLERLLHERVIAQVGSADSVSWVARTLDAGTTNGNGATGGWVQPAAGHTVQFYETDAFLLDEVATYIGAALAAGEAGVVIAAPAHRAGLGKRLRRAGVDIDAARAAGRYLALDAAETLSRFMIGDLPDAGRFVEVVGGVIAQGIAAGRGVRAFGEMVALLVAEGNQAAALRLEALWNALQQTHDFSLLCAYPIESPDSGGHSTLLDGVCAAHTRVLPAESYTALPAPDEQPRAVVLLQQKARWLEREIRERERVEAELRQREQEQADFFDNAAEGLHWVGPDGIVQRVNQAELDLLGYTREEYVGHHIAEFHADQDVIAEILARLARGEIVRDCEARLRCKDGSIKHVLINSNVLWRDGEFVHSRCFTRDITERRQAEEVRQRLAAIVESSEDAIIGKTLDAVITNWNAAAERMYGYTAEEAIGRSISMLVPPDRPDELPAIMARLRRGERIAQFETERVRKDGARLAVALTISPIRDTTGALVGASTIARDITDRKRAEAALREHIEIVETVSRTGRLLAAELDLETLVQVITDTATELAGARFGAFFYNVTDERGEHYDLYTLSGAPRAAFAQFPVPRNTALFGPTFRGEGVVRLADVTADPRYGANVPYHGTPSGHLPVRSYLAVPVVSRTGTVLGGLFFGHPEPGVFTERTERIVVGLAAQAAVAMDNARLYHETQEQMATHVDLNTALREAAEARDRALTEAQAALRVRDDFLGSISHDLRTPLSSVSGLAQLLLRQAGRSATLESATLTPALTTINAAARKMATMIDELLDLTRLSAGQALELDRRTADLVTLIQATVAESQRVRGEHHAVFETAVPALQGYWDTARLDRVVANLLSNAIKYSPSGGTITVTLTAEDTDAGVWAVIAVRDEGIGIPAADLPHIFDRFHRGANVAGQIRGVGIGLAGCKQIVELHGGSIAIASEEGTGTTVTVRLPCTTEGAAEIPRN